MNESNFEENGIRKSGVWFSALVLALITILAFANAAHDELVFDDKVFVGEDPMVGIESLTGAFNQDVWGNSRPGQGFYRPLLMIGFELQSRVFGDWIPGYHIVNIAQHIIATLLVFGFLRYLLQLRGASGRLRELAAMIAATVFAIHPIHTENINSVFNGSSIIVTIFAVGGLWWLMSRLQDRPWLAWIGFGLAYSIAILFKEEALTLPGIAVALIFLLTPGGFWQRVKRFLPVFFLLIPIAIYFYLRSKALAGDQAAGEELQLMVQAAAIPEANTPSRVLTVIGQSLWMMVWPWPLRLYYWPLTGAAQIAAIAAQAALVVAAIVLYFRHRPTLAAGLSFFLLAIAPSARLVSADGSAAHVADRYMYYPSVGIVMVLAAVVYWLARRFGSKLVLTIFLPLLLMGAAVTWERNHEWSDELTLFQTEYNLGNRHYVTLRILISKLWAENQKARIIEVCEENKDRMPMSSIFTNTCAAVYAEAGRKEDAIYALEQIAENDDIWLSAGLSLANLLIQEGRKQEGADRYAYVINRLDEPAKKEFFKGHLYLQLYPQSRKYLEIAKRHMQMAQRMDPELTEAEEFIRRIDAALNPTDENLQEATTPLQDMDVPGVKANADPTKG